ncbi:MAG: hypothetical protein ACLTHV_06205 [Parasutterella excrementihominis]
MFSRARGCFVVANECARSLEKQKYCRYRLNRSGRVAAMVD